MKQSSSTVDGSPQIKLPGLKSKILVVVGYLGLAPFFWFFRSLQRKDEFFRHHLYQSLALSFLGLCLNAIQLLPFFILIPALGFDFQSDFDTWAGRYGAFQFSQQLLSGLVSILALILSSIWLLLVVSALLGQTWRLPVLSQIASMKWMAGTVVFFTIVMYLGFFAMIGIVMDSVKITKTSRSEADVYILYTQGGYIPSPGLYETFTPPNWAVTTAFYPLVRAGMETFGDDRVSVLPLSQATFDQAVQHGKFIFIASHGGSTPGTFATSFAPLTEYGPWNVPPVSREGRLELVYFAGCEAGRLEAEWRSALGVEEMVMFDRISYVTEHMLWIWFESPSVISQLDD